MKKRKLIIFIIAFICIDLIIFYILYPHSPAKETPTTVSGQEENETETPWKFPEITFPWSAEERSKEGGAGGSGGEGEGSGGTGGGEESKPKLPKYNLTLIASISSFPISVNYYEDGEERTNSFNTPYSLLIDKGSTACVLPDTNYTIVAVWLLDGELCESLCENKDLSCSIVMDINHIAFLNFTRVTW